MDSAAFTDDEWRWAREMIRGLAAHPLVMMSLIFFAQDNPGLRTVPRAEVARFVGAALLGGIEMLHICSPKLAQWFDDPKDERPEWRRTLLADILAAMYPTEPRIAPGSREAEIMDHFPRLDGSSG